MGELEELLSQEELIDIGFEIENATDKALHGKPETITVLVKGIKYAITVQESDEGPA